MAKKTKDRVPVEVCIRSFDLREFHFYQVHNMIVDDYMPLIGCAGLALYNLYTRRAMKETQRAKIPQTIIQEHLGIKKASVSDYNLILEWCELVYVDRKHRKTNEVYLLNVKPLTPEHIEKIRQNVYEATGGLRPKQVKNARLRVTMLKRLDGWKSLGNLLDEHNQVPAHIKIVKPSDLQGQLPGFEQNGRNGHTPPSDFDALLGQVMAVFTAEGDSEDKARATAQKLLDGYGLELVQRQLLRHPARCDLLKESKAGLKNAAGLFVECVKRDEPEWTAKSRPGKFAGITEDELNAIYEQRVRAETERRATLAAAGVGEQDVSAWNATLGQLQMQMTRATFDAWLDDTEPVRRDGDNLIIGVGDDKAKDWLENRLFETVLRTAQAHGLTALKFEVSKDTPAPIGR